LTCPKGPKKTDFCGIIKEREIRGSKKQGEEDQGDHTDIFDLVASYKMRTKC
jgi:hypothetical protein